MFWVTTCESRWVKEWPMNKARADWESVNDTRR